MKPPGRALLALLLALGAAAAHAHGGDAAAALRWNTRSEVLLPIALSAMLYATGVLRAWARVGIGRGFGGRRVLAAAGGWGALVLALLSPLDAGAERLFSLHMVQHELLMAVAAPLLCLAHPLMAALWVLPRRWRARLRGMFRSPRWTGAWRALLAPATAWALHAAVLWGWHAPAAFNASLASTGWHTTQHIAFLASALIYWWSLLGAPARSHGGPALLSLFTTLLHTSALGALLALSSRAWYAIDTGMAAAWGLDPLTDQQLGGLVMWGPGALPYLMAALWLAHRWIGPGSAGAPIAGTAPHEHARHPHFRA